MNLLIAGETFSPNLGDPLIALAMKDAFLAETSFIDFLDISGRTTYSVPPDASKTRHSRKRSPLHAFLSTNLTRGIVGSMNEIRDGRFSERLRLWDAKLVKADALVIGGGQLLSDLNLEFPSRVFHLSWLARRRGIPFAVFGCGVSDNWTLVGAAMLRWSLRRACFISVRDEVSRRRLAGLIAPKIPLIAHPDPVFALEADDLSFAGSLTQTVGLNVIDLNILHQFLPSIAPATDEKYARFWCNLAKRIIDDGFKPAFFSNGDVRDQFYAEMAQSACIASDLETVCLPRPEHPESLLAYLRGFSRVVATRMHAGIAAAALGRPVAALIWDRKVKNVWDLVDGSNAVEPAFFFGQRGWEEMEEAMLRSQRVITARSHLRKETLQAAKACMAAVAK